MAVKIGDKVKLLNETGEGRVLEIPSGGKVRVEIDDFKNLAIGVIPLDEDNNTWIVGQYRYPLQKYSWEIPEGGGDRNLPPVDSAKRELMEECGIKAQSWTPLMQMHTSNSATDEVVYLFVARDLSFHEPEPEENEEIEVRKMPFDELFRMVMDGEITDSLTAAGVMKLKLLMDRGEM